MSGFTPKKAEEVIKRIVTKDAWSVPSTAILCPFVLNHKQESQKARVLCEKFCMLTKALFRANIAHHCEK